MYHFVELIYFDQGFLFHFQFKGKLLCWSLLQKRLQQRCFLPNSAKFLKNIFHRTTPVDGFDFAETFFSVKSKHTVSENILKSVIMFMLKISKYFFFEASDLHSSYVVLQRKALLASDFNFICYGALI